MLQSTKVKIRGTSRKFSWRTQTGMKKKSIPISSQREIVLVVCNNYILFVHLAKGNFRRYSLVSVKFLNCVV